MSQAIRGADRSRERTKQTTAFPNERLWRRRSVRWGSLGCEWKKAKSRACSERRLLDWADFKYLFLAFFFLQRVNCYHYWTIKWLRVLLLSIYAITHVPITLQSHTRGLDKRVSLFEGALVSLSALTVSESVYWTCVIQV